MFEFFSSNVSLELFLFIVLCSFVQLLAVISLCTSFEDLVYGHSSFFTFISSSVEWQIIIIAEIVNIYFWTE